MSAIQVMLSAVEVPALEPGTYAVSVGCWVEEVAVAVMVGVVVMVIVNVAVAVGMALCVNAIPACTVAATCVYICPESTVGCNEVPAPQLDNRISRIMQFDKKSIFLIIFPSMVLK